MVERVFNTLLVMEVLQQLAELLPAHFRRPATGFSSPPVVIEWMQNMTRTRAGPAPLLPEKPLLMLMDGHALVHRAWHAFEKTPLTLRKTGEDVRGVYGFANTFLKAIQDWKPTHCAIAFDLPAPTFRHIQYAEYKAQRPEAPQELRAQFPWVRRLMEAWGVPIFEVEGYEADDILGTLCCQATEQNMETIILTGDTDTLQLVSPTVQVVLSRGIQDRVIYDEAAVRERYGGLSPRQQPEVKALQGDKTDNIRGVPGIGPKTAIKLIQDFGSIEGLYANLDTVLPARIRELLASHEADARQGLELTTIVTDVPITLDAEACRFWSFDRERVMSLLRELEFTSIAARVPESKASTSQPVQGVLLESRAEEKGGYRIVTNVKDLESLISELRAAGSFAFDTETTGKDPMSCDLVGISFSAAPGKATYLPLGHREGPQVPLEEALALLKPLLEDHAVAKTAHNGNYDSTVMANYGIQVRNLDFDTMVAAHVLGEKALGLKNLAFTRLHVEMTPIEALIGTGRNQKTMAQVPMEAAGEYAGADADMTGRLRDVFERELKKEQTLWGLFTDMEMPLVPVLVRMQRHGISLDAERLRAMSKELGEQLARIEEDVLKTVGHAFSLNSTQQLAEVLYNELRLPKTRRTKTGYSTDAAVLEALREMLGQGKVAEADPRALDVLDGILEYRELSKLKSTYVDALPLLINPRTGRVHTSYNQTGSATGRISSNDPNLQNIPVRTELGKGVRKAFVAQDAPRWSLLAADYSQIELRVLAHLSRDKGLVEAFLRGEDIHAATASQVYNVPIPFVTPDMRRIAKVMNFGVIYGLSAYGISQQTDLTAEEGARFIEDYFSRYPGIRDYLEATKTQARKAGYVETVSGRRRYIPEVNASIFQVRQAAERMAVNMPVQGTAADIIKLAMINIDHRMQQEKVRARMLLQVHDELIFEVPEEEMETMRAMVVELMPAALELIVPLRVELKTGYTWGDME
ncbi:MAG: polA [Dehalococcoidia bacterium]|nr:polA [Dehalococcoidia bacterium]